MSIERPLLAQRRAIVNRAARRDYGVRRGAALVDGAGQEINNVISQRYDKMAQTFVMFRGVSFAACFHCFPQCVKAGRRVYRANN